MKMKKSRKILALLLSLIMLVGAISVSASAAEETPPANVFTETEPNNTPEAADEIELLTEVSGNLNAGNADWIDVDWYKVSVEQSGVLSVEFTHPVFESLLSYYTVDVIGVDGGNEFLLSSTISLGTDGKITTVGSLVASGTYYVRVTGGDVVSEDGYTLTVTLGQSRDGETEPNNTFAEADIISTDSGAAYFGSIGAADDIDLYAFNLAAKGYVDISVSDDSAAAGNAEYTVSVMKFGSGEAVAPETVAVFVTDSAKPGTTFPRLGLEAGTYFVKVEISGNFVGNSAYALSVKASAYAFYETEVNDNWQTADVFDATVNTGDSYTGTFTNNIYANLSGKNDADWFAVSHNSSGVSSVDVIVRVDAGANADNWKVELYNSGLLSQPADTYDISSYAVPFEKNVKGGSALFNTDTDIVCKVDTASYSGDKLVVRVYCDGEEVDTSMYTVICVVSVDNTPEKSWFENLRDYFKGLSQIEWPFLSELIGKVFEDFTFDTVLGLIGNVGSQLIKFLFNFLG